MPPTEGSAPQSGSEIDAVAEADLRDLAAVRGAGSVSIFLPTARHGAETMQGPVRLRNLLAQARTELGSAGALPVAADDLLAPVDALVDDTDAWQHQADGLAIFVWPGGHRWFRVPLALQEEVRVGDRLRLQPLLPLTVASGRFHLLALSQNAVRLYQGSERALTELDPGPMPTSIEEALAHEDPERELQVRAGGGGTAQFHGHGAGDEVDKATVERFLRAVDSGVTARVGAGPEPLVLAGVAYYGPIYRSVTSRRRVLEAMIEGNPEHLSPADLHARAWPIVAPALAGDEAALLERAGDGLGTGTTITEPEEIVQRAGEGRVDTLLVTQDDIDDSDLAGAVDHAVAAAFDTGAAVVAVEAARLPRGGPMAAILRY